MVGTANGAPATGAVSVPGTMPNDTRNFAVVGWSANLGSDWNAVYAGRPLTLVTSPGDGLNAAIGQAAWSMTTAPPPAGWTRADLTSQLGPNAAGLPGGFYGVSSVASNVVLNDQGGPWYNVWGSTPFGGSVPISGMSLNFYEVPEPDVCVAVGWGIAAFLMLRRRKF